MDIWIDRDNPISGWRMDGYGNTTYYGHHPELLTARQCGRRIRAWRKAQGQMTRQRALPRIIERHLAGVPLSRGIDMRAEMGNRICRCIGKATRVAIDKIVWETILNGIL